MAECHADHLCQLTRTVTRTPAARRRDTDTVVYTRPVATPTECPVCATGRYTQRVNPADFAVRRLSLQPMRVESGPCHSGYRATRQRIRRRSALSCSGCIGPSAGRSARSRAECDVGRFCPHCTRLRCTDLDWGKTTWPRPASLVTTRCSR